MTRHRQVKSVKPCESKHTPCPSGYIARAEWADKMSKTHKQQKCPDCGLYAIWVPKADTNSQESDK